MTQNQPESGLQPLAPREALDMFVEQEEHSLSPNTLYNYKQNVGRFIDWCEATGIENLNTLSGRDMHRFRTERAGEITEGNLERQLYVIRKFVRFCESIDGVPDGVAAGMLIPNADRESRDEKIEADRATAILDTLDSFEYASRSHAVFAFLWHTGIRIGTAHSLDVTDLNVSNRQLGVRHRPDTGTHLKQGEQAERLLAIDDETSKLLRDYIEWNRIDAEDEHGRDPLFTTARGRASKTCLRRAIYSVTRPCEYTGECPHDRNIDDCKAAQARKYASECPSSLSPHPIRRGSITHHLNDAPQRAVSERMNVSLDVLEKHYDRRTEEEKMDKRKEYFTDQ